jgi:hypothetical protein
LFQFVAICRAILRDSSHIQAFLSDMDLKIEEECKTLVNAARHGNKQAEHSLDVVDNNRGKILFYKSRTEELLAQVQSAENKIRAALIW